MNKQVCQGFSAEIKKLFCLSISIFEIAFMPRKYKTVLAQFLGLILEINERAIYSSTEVHNMDVLIFQMILFIPKPLIKYCRLIFYCVKYRNFTKFLGMEILRKLRKLCVSTIFLYREIRWNFGISWSVLQCILRDFNSCYYINCFTSLIPIICKEDIKVYLEHCKTSFSCNMAKTCIRNAFCLRKTFYAHFLLAKKIFHALQF